MQNIVYNLAGARRLVEALNDKVADGRDVRVSHDHVKGFVQAAWCGLTALGGSAHLLEWQELWMLVYEVQNKYPGREGSGEVYTAWRVQVVEDLMASLFP